MTSLAPRDEEEIAEVVRAALSSGTAIDIVGGGSRSGLGRPAVAETRLSTLGLEGVTLYEPTELVLTARAGTPLSSITALLDKHGQEPAFEPIDHGPLYGKARGLGTIGGLIAVNASGPRRIKAGAARDHLLGFRAITGRGEIFQSGGRVMKNVTGYDMCKLMAGSHGTFSVLSEITLKVLPKAETELTLCVVDLDDEKAVRVMTSVSGLAFEVSGFAHLPTLTSDFSSPAPGSLADKPLTALRLEGPETSVNSRIKDLTAYLAKHVRVIEVMDAPTSRNFWADLRDVIPFSGTTEQVWRISTAPTEGAALVSDLIERDVPLRCHYYDWAGGLIWIAVASADDAHGSAIRKVVDGHGGHATLVRAGDDIRVNTPVFHPQPAPLAALTERLRRSFDPELVLNRGRVREDL